jgi:hypothetical protein
MLTAAMTCWVAGPAAAGNPRYYEENGITYRETTSIERRPVSRTEYIDQQQTVYRREPKTDYHDIYQTVHVPVTRYQWEARWRGRWNPFVQPYVVQQLVPRTHFETRTEVVQMPVTRTELIPETHVQRVPITVRETVEEEVTRRVAVNPLPASAVVSTTRPAVNSGIFPTPGSVSTPVVVAQPVVRQEMIGGIARLDNDPPRYADGGWRASQRTIRR